MIKKERENRIPKNLRKILIQKCNQEDFQSLVSENGGNVCYIKKAIVKVKNRLLIEVGNRFEVPFMSVFLTQKCTLRCVNCSDLMPYYKRPESFPAEKVLFCLKRYLSAVDSVHFLLLCGGETFLYPELDKILEFCIGENKIKHIGIVTNGTLIPDDKVCGLLANPRIRVRISNYRCVREKRKKTLQYLTNHGILIEDLKGQKWYDVGDFACRGRDVRQMEHIFSQCLMNNCFEINRNKVIYCARQRGGELGLTPQIPKQDYVSLKIKNKGRLRKELLHMYEKKYLQTCNYCDGITGQSKRVTPGEQ